MRIVLMICAISATIVKSGCETQKSSTIVRDNFMLFVDGPQGKLFQMALNGTTVVELSTAARKPQNPVAVDYDPLTRWIYWTDIDTHSIRRTKLPSTDGTSSSSSSRSTTFDGRPDSAAVVTGSQLDDDQVFLQLTPASSPEGVVVDPVAKLLFYTDNGRNTINVVRTENSRDHRVLITYAKHPRTVQIDPTRRHIYWTDWGLGTVERASYNGLNRTVIVHGEDKWINGLALDLTARQMYWTDAQRGVIERSNMDGTGRIVLIDERRATSGALSGDDIGDVITGRSNVTLPVKPHYYGVALDETYIYYTDWARGIFRAFKNGTNRQKLTPVDSTAFTILNGIKVYKYGIFQQTLGSSSGCRQRNGGCSNLCVPLTVGFTCMCPDLARLSDDNATCSSGIQADGPDVIWVENDGGTTSYVRGIRGDPVEFLRTRDVLTWSVRSPGWHWTALDMNYNEKKLFIADKTDRFIVQLSVNGSLDLKVVLSGTSSAVNGIAVDWVAGNIYWTDGLYRWIAVTSARPAVSGHKTVVSQGLDRPFGIAVWPQKGLLFWSDWGASDGRIQYSTLLGEQVQTLVDRDLVEPRGLAMDYSSSRLFWCTEHSIESILTDGTARMTHAMSTFNNFIGISLHTSYIIATEQKSDGRGPQLWIFDQNMDVNSGYKLALSRHPTAVIMYDALRQQKLVTPCQQLNCQHLCITTGASTAQCACYNGYNIASDQAHCIEDRTLLHGPAYIYSIGDQICSIPAGDAQRSSVSTSSASPSSPSLITLTAFDPNELCFFGGQAISVSSSVGAGVAGGSGVGSAGKYEFRALDFNYRRGELFFSETGFRVRTIRRAHLVERQNNSAIVHGVGIVKGLAVDWLNDNLYWTDYTHNQVWMSRVDGRYQKIIASNLSGPSGIVIDQTKKKLYWTEDGVNGAGLPRIVQANMDGTELSTLYGDVMKPAGLGIDYSPREDRLYWTDTGRNTIESLSLQSMEHRIENVPQYAGKSVVDVASFQDFLLYTSLEPGNSSSLHVFEKSNKREVNREGLRHVAHAQPYDVIAFAESKQPLYNKAYCGEFTDNGGCEQLLTSSSDGKCQCACADGFTLNSNGRTCDSAASMKRDNFFLVADDYRNQIYMTDVGIQQVSAVRMAPLDRPIGVEYDFLEDRVYWTDFESSVIRRVFFNGSNLETIRNLPRGSRVDGLAIASQSRLLYYSDSDRNQIGIMSLDGRFRKVLVKQNVSNPRAIVVDQQNGYIYFPVRSAGRGRIDRCNMDGTHCKTLIKSNSSWPSGLAIDFDEKQLYWCDAHTERIETASLDGTGRRTLHLGSPDADPFGIAIEGEFVYWTDWGVRGLFRIHRDGSGRSERLLAGMFRGLNDIKFFNRATASAVSTACSVNNGGCSHFCLPTPDGSRVCACPDTGNGRSVEPPDGMNCTGVAQCSATLPNGRFHPQCSRSVGSLCPFTCNPGYGPVSTESVICRHSLKWDRDPATLCQDSTCPLLLNSPHSITDPDCPPLANPGVTCKQSCVEGYVKTGGSSSRTCTVGLEWTGDDIRCTAFADVINTTPASRVRPTAAAFTWCPPVAPPPEVIVEPIDCLTYRQSVGSECLLRCATGLSLVSGDQRRVCADDRKWSGAMIVCVNDSVVNAGGSLPTLVGLNHGGSKAGLIVGLIFGLVFISATAVAAFVLFRRYREQQKPPINVGNASPSPPTRFDFRGPDNGEYQPSQFASSEPPGVKNGEPTGHADGARLENDYTSLSDFDSIKLRITTGLNSLVRFTGGGGSSGKQHAHGIDGGSVNLDGSASSGYQSTEGSVRGVGGGSGSDVTMAFDNPLFRAFALRSSDRRKLVHDSATGGAESNA